MSVILAIDPGPVQSAWLVFDTETGAPQVKSFPVFGIQSNDWLLGYIRSAPAWWDKPAAIVIEKIEGSYGRVIIGGELLETVFWSGRFVEAAHPVDAARIGRKAVAAHLCGVASAGDSHVRAALIDRFGGKASIRKGGALFRVSKDVWAALALACVWADRNL